MIIDWQDFIKMSMDNNWNIKSTLSKIEEALIDIKGKQHTEFVIGVLKNWIANSIGRVSGS